MPYIIKITRAANKDLSALPTALQKRMAQAIRELANDPRPPDAIKMEGYGNLYRKRVGSYRIAYEIHDKKILVIVTAAAKRGAIYHLLKRRIK